MQKNLKNLYQKFNLNSHILFWGCIYFGISVYIKNHWWIAFTIVFLVFYFKRWIFLVCFFYFVSIPTSTIKIVDISGTYSTVQYQHQFYILATTKYDFDDEIQADFSLQRIDIPYYTKKGIAEKMVLKNIQHVKKSNHPKSLLYRYIQQHFSEKAKSFLMNVFFSVRINTFKHFLLQFHIVGIMYLVKKKNKKISFLIGSISLLFEFKLLAMFKLLEMVGDYLKIPKKEMYLITIFVVFIFFKHELYSIALLFYILYKLLALYQHVYAVKSMIVLFSFMFFKRIDVFVFLFYRYLIVLLIVNGGICTVLLFNPSILERYIDVAEQIFQIFYMFTLYQHLEIPVFILCILLLLFFWKKWYFKLLFYCLILLPNHFRLYQEVIIDLTHNKTTVIVKPNLGELPIVIADEIQKDVLHQYGITHYTTKHAYYIENDQNYLWYLNDYFYYGKMPLSKYRNIPITFYVGQFFDESVLNHHPQFVVLLDNTIKNDELLLIEKRVDYFKTKQSFRIIYFCGLRFILW